MNARLEVTLNEYLPLRDVVFNTLRKAILKGELAPGERLTEKKLAEKMGVSRTPIREAIRKLELEELVVMVPRKGAEVAMITEQSIRDVLEVREALEGLAVTIASHSMREEDREKLIQANKAFKIAANSKNKKEIAKIDIEFHDIIYTSTKNRKLIQIINNLREQMYRFRLEYIEQIVDYSGLVHEHDVLVESIITKDEKRAREIVTQHIRNQEKVVIEKIK